MTPLEAALAAINAVDCEANAVISAKCRGLIRGYHERWHDDIGDFIPTGVEKVYSTRLLNPATGKSSTVMGTAGKIDLEYRRRSNGVTGILDHKSTSDDISDPAGTYWRTEAVNNQSNHYMLMKWTLGDKVTEATWDCIRKPTINPKQLKSKAEHAAIVASGKYCNQTMPPATMEWLQTNQSEDLAMYEARLFQDCTEVRPNNYFQRRALPRLDSELMDYASDLWDASQLVLEARRKNRWSKHPGSCMAYGSPCRFLGICSGFDQPDSCNWKPRESVHSELTQEQDKDTLTFSSIRCFQTCPRKFYYAYQLGIEKVTDEESEALRIGNLIHLALEAYWKALLPKENENGNCTNSASSVESASTKTSCPF